MQNQLYSGLPSIILPHRPFYSIIVPCYNSRNTLGNLLDSILQQNMNDDLEVILSDDCSTESYQDIVDKYKDILSIRQVKTEYNFGPGNTRERGVSVAEGEWVLFADHDDEFIPNTLPRIKEEILKNNEQYYAIANFYEKNALTGKIIQEMVGFRNWNHAKFYNLDNLWKAYDIHFKKDLLTHEDIYISSRINCAIKKANDDNPLFINIFCYIWNNRPTTVSRVQYKDHTFLEVFFKDYVESTGYVYLDQFENFDLDKDYAIDSAIEVLLFCYFYTQGFKFHGPDKWIRENDDVCRKYLVDIKRIFGINNQYIWDYAAKNDAALYTKTKDTAKIAAGPYIETLSFMDWLNYLHEDIMRTSLSEVRNKN